MTVLQPYFLQGLRAPTALEYTVGYYERERAEVDAQLSHSGFIIAHATSALVRKTEQISLVIPVLWEFHW